MISWMQAASLNCLQVWATTGRPATSSQSLSTLAPMRVPLPAATMMAEVIRLKAKGRKLKAKDKNRLAFDFSLQPLASIQLMRQTMRALFKSYCDISIFTRSPEVRRTNFFRILPEMVAST